MVGISVIFLNLYLKLQVTMLGRFQKECTNITSIPTEIDFLHLIFTMNNTAVSCYSRIFHLPSVQDLNLYKTLITTDEYDITYTSYYIMPQRNTFIYFNSFLNL